VAHFPLRAMLFLAALALAAGAWFAHRGESATQSSITVKLPPAHPVAARPGFAFQQ